jgi:hypothetical protein
MPLRIVVWVLALLLLLLDEEDDNNTNEDTAEDDWDMDMNICVDNSGVPLVGKDQASTFHFGGQLDSIRTRSKTWKKRFWSIVICNALLPQGTIGKTSSCCGPRRAGLVVISTMAGLWPAYVVFS